MTVFREISPMLALAHRDLIKLLRDRARLVSTLIFPFIFIGALGGALQSNFGNIAGYDFLVFTFTGVLAQTMFQTTALGLISLIEDRENDFSQELFVAPVSRYAIVVGRFYEDLAEKLVAGARRTFEEAGGEVEVHAIPGAFELPLAARYCVDSGRFEGVACLGAVIRGETDHYDYVCAETARGIQDVQLRSGVPCAFGVLTVETMDQALARTGGGKRDQGRHAAEAVVALARMRTALRG